VKEFSEVCVKIYRGRSMRDTWVITFTVALYGSRKKDIICSGGISEGFCKLFKIRAYYFMLILG